MTREITRPLNTEGTERTEIMEEEVTKRMHFTTVRLERPEGTPLLAGIPAQIEGAAEGELEAFDLAGARPFDLFWLYTTQGVPAVPIQRRDVLFDELNSDPETGQPAKYRVVGLVETFANHQEVLCERVVGG